MLVKLEKIGKNMQENKILFNFWELSAYFLLLQAIFLRHWIVCHVLIIFPFHPLVSDTLKHFVSVLSHFKMQIYIATSISLNWKVYLISFLPSNLVALCDCPSLLFILLLCFYCVPSYHSVFFGALLLLST